MDAGPAGDDPGAGPGWRVDSADGRPPSTRRGGPETASISAAAVAAIRSTTRFSISRPPRWPGSSSSTVLARLTGSVIVAGGRCRPGSWRCPGRRPGSCRRPGPTAPKTIAARNPKNPPTAVAMAISSPANRPIVVRDMGKSSGQ
ncbi:hypothetical protein [Fodinicola feengrottensis]|uniref:hypothetical protein n=1 Tax=Fodinicola feengrottensis TaxID=435914 RepID=UPI0036F2B95E